MSDGPQNIKYYSVDEANKLIPQLTSLIKELHQVNERLEKQEAEIDALELISGKPEKSQHSPEVDQKITTYNETMGAFYDVIDKIQAFGCFLKDPDKGRIDFYSKHQDKVIFLCWCVGEPEIQHWHEVGQGYGQRQPISTLEEGF